MKNMKDDYILILKNQIDCFYQLVDNINTITNDENNLDTLFIEAHSIKGLALYYGCHYIKKAFLDYENYLEKYRIFQQNNINEIIAYLNKFKDNIYEYLDNYDDSLLRENYDAQSKLLYSKIRKYKFTINTTSLKNLINVLNTINNLVFIMKVTRSKTNFVIYFMSNLEMKKINLLLSSFKGVLKEIRFKDPSYLFRINILKNMFCDFEPYNSIENYLNKDFIKNSIYNGITNLAIENDTYVNSKISINTKYIPKKVIEIILIPILEILKNAISHGKENCDNLAIKVAIKRRNKKYVIKVFNKGDRINTSEITKKVLEKNIISRENVLSMKKEDIINLVFDKFFSSASTANGIHGHGIGLYSAKKIITEHNGTLTLKNRLRGLEFYIVIPQ